MFDPKGRFVVVSGKRPRLLDARTGRRLATLPESGALEVPSFSADGRHLVTVYRRAQGEPETVRILDGDPPRPVGGPIWPLIRLNYRLFRIRPYLELVAIRGQAPSVNKRGLTPRGGGS